MGRRHRSDIPGFFVQTIPMNLWKQKSCSPEGFTIPWVSFPLHKKKPFISDLCRLPKQWQDHSIVSMRYLFIRCIWYKFYFGHLRRAGGKVMLSVVGATFWRALSAGRAAYKAVRAVSGLCLTVIFREMKLFERSEFFISLNGLAVWHRPRNYRTALCPPRPPDKAPTHRLPT